MTTIIFLALALTLPEMEITVPDDFDHVGQQVISGGETEVYRSSETNLVLMVCDIPKVDKEFQKERSAYFENFCQGIIDKGGKHLNVGLLDHMDEPWDWRTYVMDTPDGPMMGISFFYYRGLAEGSVIITLMGLGVAEEDLRDYGIDLFRKMVGPVEMDQ